MGGGGNPAPLLAPQKFPGPSSSSLTPDQQNRMQEDLAERERQAAQLASAMTPTGVGQVLQAPPPLVSMVPPSGTSIKNTSTGSDMDMQNINWNAIPELGNPDDMDMDFAAMFDAEQEQNFLVGSGHHHHYHHGGGPTTLHLNHPGKPSSSSSSLGRSSPSKSGIPNPLNSSSG